MSHASQLSEPDNPTSREIATELTSIETTTGRVIIYNKSNARERISSSFTLPIKP